MRKIFITPLVAFICVILSSCSIIQFDSTVYLCNDNTYTIVNGRIYSGVDAEIAYDFYNELDGFKPIMLKVNDSK